MSRIIKRYIICCVCVLFMHNYIVCEAAGNDQACDNGGIVIALDPGHGGDEDGAQYYGMKEKYINYRIAGMVKQGLEQYDNVTVVLTREGDEKVGLEERVKRAKAAEADVLISLHCNASVSHESHGSQVYVSTAQRYCEELQKFADYFMGEFEALGLDNAGVFARVTQMGTRRDDGSFDDYYGVIRHSYNKGIPAVIVEHCYMDSAEDVGYVKNYDKLKQLAEADVNAIAAYYGFKDRNGSTYTGKHARKYGATTKALELNYYDSPCVTGIELVDYDNRFYGMATYSISIEDGCGVKSVYLVYRDDTGSSINVPLNIDEPLFTGTYEVKGVVPQQLAEGSYRLAFIGAYNRAGYDAAYNHLEGHMIGYGKCDWLNEFLYDGEADIIIEEQASINNTHIEKISKALADDIKKRRPISMIGLLEN